MYDMIMMHLYIIGIILFALFMFILYVKNRQIDLVVKENHIYKNRDTEEEVFVMYVMNNKVIYLGEDSNNYEVPYTHFILNFQYER